MDGTEAAAAAPTSSADIAASVVHEAEQQDTSSVDTGGETRIDTTNLVEETTTQPKKEPTPAELSAAAKFLLKQGHKLKKEDGRDNWAPLKTVEGMLDRYVEEHRMTWNGEKTTIEARAKELENYINDLRASVFGDPHEHIRELSKHDKRYAAFLEQKREEAKAVDLTEPGPDIDLGNGKWTYSQEQNDKRIEWKARQLLDERLKPWEEREKAAKQRADQDKFDHEVSQRGRQQMQEAQSWPMFGQIAADGSLSPFQSEVLDELKKDTEAAKAAGERPTMTLRQAYLEVRARHQEPDKVRERVIEELRTAPKAPALSRQTTDTPRTPGPRSSVDIVRQTIAKLESGA